MYFMMNLKKHLNLMLYTLPVAKIYSAVHHLYVRGICTICYEVYRIEYNSVDFSLDFN